MLNGKKSFLGWSQCLTFNFGGLWVLGVLVPAMLALSAVGCCQKQDDQITALNKDKLELKTQNDALRNQIASMQDSEAETARKLQTREAELANREAELMSMRGRTGDGNARRGGAAGGAPGWEQGLYGDKTTLGSDLLFDSGKATLKAGATARLDALVRDLKTHYPNMMIRVYGHTDNSPIVKSAKLWDDNLELSANRAMAVTRYLIGKGINPKLIETVAMGEYHPEGSDKAKNRRVDIYVIKAK